MLVREAEEVWTWSRARPGAHLKKSTSADSGGPAEGEREKKEGTARF
jgi:hypothetical protein